VADDLPERRKISPARSRIRRHLATLITMAATTTLATTACACDMLPPPANPQLDIHGVEVEAVWSADGSVIEVTIKPLAGQPPAVFDSAVADIKGGSIVSSTGGASLMLRVRVDPSSTDVTGTISYTSGASPAVSHRVKLELTPEAQPKPGQAVKAWLTELPTR
jgi:hypothetical protein